ncbi:glycosyltransferase family 4 protein [Cellulomonas soli]|uniref:Glycosyl transferase n=1 Tax=Cellulomonas soli TaxID=931535 RepID=A0A512P7Z1_9CELL|nr:glycosyltransferase family 4 protein [Cellulomonas soli]NYI57552.1 glycosyltransferase involved in cell wall biosynthesis [Cellulomonas soli]GEP67329.1 glycosyl transferase [Cellulomonas soli]
MRVVIASTTVPHINGGGRLIVEWTAAAMREHGHEVEEFYLPFPTSVRPDLSAVVGLRAMPFAGAGDRLVAIRWPAHLIRHENKATWFIHHYRQLFDLWDTPYRDVPANAEGIAYREALRRIDNLGLAESQSLFTNSLIVRDRVRQYNGLEAEPLFPPLGGDTSRFHQGPVGDYVFYPSRVTPIKRQLIAVEAMRYTTSGVRLVIAGKPEVAPYEHQLRAYVREHGLEDRVELRMGWLDEEDKISLLAGCLALAYLPVDEDSYGYPSLEASHSAKPIVTLTDAGGALEFVRDGVEGLVAEPDPRRLAEAFDRLYEDREETGRMGERSHARRAELNIAWPHVIDRLLGLGA